MALESAWRIGTTRYDDLEEERYRVLDWDPARASFDGRKTLTITRGAESLRLETWIRIHGEVGALDVRVSRTLSRDGGVLRTRTWHERIPRRWH